jgi:hypothetical protein
MVTGRRTPSGGNSRRGMFIAVGDLAKRRSVAEALKSPPEIGINRFAREVPAFIAARNHPPRGELGEVRRKILARPGDG